MSEKDFLLLDTEMNKEKFDFERFKEEAMKGLYEGKKMGGTDVSARPSAYWVDLSGGVALFDEQTREKSEDAFHG